MRARQNRAYGHPPYSAPALQSPVLRPLICVTLVTPSTVLVIVVSKLSPPWNFVSWWVAVPAQTMVMVRVLPSRLKSLSVQALFDIAFSVSVRTTAAGPFDFAVSSGFKQLLCVPDWPLGLGRAVGLDLGRRCPLGLRAVPLRPLGLRQWRLGLDTRSDGYRGRQTVGGGGLRAGAGRFHRWRRLGRLAFYRWSRSGLGGPGTGRGLCALLSHEPELLPDRECIEHYGREYGEHY